EPLCPTSKLAYSATVVEAGYASSADRLRHTDGLNPDVLEWLRELRRRARSLVLAGVGAFGVLGAPLAMSFGNVGGSSSGQSSQDRIGRLHTLPSTPETVRLGVFDSTLPNVLEIESGDVVIYPDTWSHFMNRLQPGVS